MASTNRSDGEGSIYQRHLDTCPPAIRVAGPDGKKRWHRDPHTCKGPFVGVVVTGWRDGKPIRKKVSGSSKASVKAKIRKVQEQLTAGELPKGRIPTVEEWMTYWLDQIAVHKVRPSTLRGYRTSVSCYITPLLGHHRLDRLTPEHIANAWRHLQDVGRPGAEKPEPLSPTTALQAHRILARALKVAHQRGVVTRNVATLLDAPTPADTEFEVLDEEQARTVLTLVHGRRNAARWSVALALGLRQGEALGLRWEDLDLDAGVIHVRKALGRVKGKGLVLGPVKSRAGKRRFGIPAQLLTQLRAHRVAQNEERLFAGSKWEDGNFVFARPDGRPIDPKRDWQDWKDILAEAGLPSIRLHDARHTAATLMLAQGVPTRVAMEILGHSRITITQGYQHAVDSLLVAAAEKMNTTLWGEQQG